MPSDTEPGFFIVPFAFVYNPALLLNGTIVQTILATAAMVICLYAVAIGFEGILSEKGPLVDTGHVASWRACFWSTRRTPFAFRALFVLAAAILWLRKGTRRESMAGKFTTVS